MRSHIVILAAAAIVASAVGARGQAPPPPANPVVQVLKDNWANAVRDIRDSAKIMPEANYGFRPVESVRTFGQILAHVAGVNYEYCSAAKGVPSPHAEADFEKSATTKEAIDKALNESIAYCDDIVASLSDRTAAAPVQMPFGMGMRPRMHAIVLNIAHVSEHYGNLVTYFRIKGIVPPSSRRQQ